MPLGLAGLVQFELGQELDKTLQCSAWGERPLSHEQVQRHMCDDITFYGLASSPSCVQLHHTALHVACPFPSDWHAVSSGCSCSTQRLMQSASCSCWATWFQLHSPHVTASTVPSQAQQHGQDKMPVKASRAAVKLPRIHHTQLQKQWQAVMHSRRVLGANPLPLALQRQLCAAQFRTTTTVGRDCLRARPAR